MNALEKYPGKLPSSRALTSKMQQRGAMYLNIKDDMDYKSLYGEKNPALDNTVTQDKDFYMQMLQEYKVKYHIKRTSKQRNAGGLRLLERATTKSYTRRQTVELEDN